MVFSGFCYGLYGYECNMSVLIAKTDEFWSNMAYGSIGVWVMIIAALLWLMYITVKDMENK